MGGLNYELNRIAGTTNLDAQAAANVYAGTTNKDLVGALNAKAGTSGLELLGVVNRLAGTTNYDLLRALEAIPTFSPAAVTGLVGWWDASLASSITSAVNRVSQWNDRSTSGFNLTAATTARPTTGANTQNGLNLLTFDGVANQIRATGLTTPAVNTATWFMVFKPTATTNYERALALAGPNNDFGGADVIAAIIRHGSELSWASYYNLAEIGNVTVTNAAHIIGVQRNGDAYSIWRDGVAGTGATGLGTANFGFTTVTVGNQDGGGDDFYTGHIGEVLWYSTAVSPANRLRLETYLRTKWGTP